MFELTREEAIGNQAYNAVSILSSPFLDSLRSKLDEKGLHKIVISYFDKNREKKTYETYFTYYDESKKRILVKCIDITDKITFEEGLKQSLKSFRDIISKSPVMVVNVDQDGMIIFTNPAFQQHLGYTDEELISKSFYDLIDRNYLENNIFDFRGFLGEETKQVELPLINKSGKIALLNGIFYPGKENENHIRSFICFFTEISDNAIQINGSNLFTSIVNNAFDGIALSIEGRIILANDAFANIFGYENNTEVLNKELIEFSSNDDI
ncbi:MAG TPA: PAS domain S-box protein, partial [Ignavibacteriaceae bacterium]|nr:PAS domain S-box protein [Ignavibacteriaceae bacterium]